MLPLLYRYRNGNYLVNLFEDGTKERLFNDPPSPLFPESIDLKITNKCELNCPFCHENSSISGSHGDIFRICSLLRPLPPGVEIAIGGGNPMLHPELETFLRWLQQQGLIANITINSRQLISYQNKLYTYRKEKLIHGLGISFDNKHPIDLSKFIDSNTVFHLIAGYHSVNDLTYLMNKYDTIKVLILGYKQFKRGTEFFNKNKENICNNLRELEVRIAELLYNTNLLISFDNLALEQLNINNKLAKEYWEQHYMGDDGRFTMYIDGVDETYAISSVSHTRHRLLRKDTIFQIFQTARVGGANVC